MNGASAVGAGGGTKQFGGDVAGLCSSDICEDYRRTIGLTKTATDLASSRDASGACCGPRTR